MVLLLMAIGYLLVMAGSYEPTVIVQHDRTTSYEIARRVAKEADCELRHVNFLYRARSNSLFVCLTETDTMRVDLELEKLEPLPVNPKEIILKTIRRQELEKPSSSI